MAAERVTDVSIKGADGRKIPAPQLSPLPALALGSSRPTLALGRNCKWKFAETRKSSRLSFHQNALKESMLLVVIKLRGDVGGGFNLSQGIKGVWMHSRDVGYRQRRADVPYG